MKVETLSLCTADRSLISWKDWYFTCRCQAKFLTCEISDLMPCAHAQSNILHIKYAEKTDD